MSHDGPVHMYFTYFRDGGWSFFYQMGWFPSELFLLKRVYHLFCFLLVLLVQEKENEFFHFLLCPFLLMSRLRLHEFFLSTFSSGQPQVTIS